MHIHNQGYKIQDVCAETVGLEDGGVAVIIYFHFSLGGLWLREVVQGVTSICIYLCVGVCVVGRGLLSRRTSCSLRLPVLYDSGKVSVLPIMPHHSSEHATDS